MAQTGRLGTADSQLGNLLLAFAGADDLLPSTGTISGRLGTPASLLGNMMPAWSGPDGPKVIHLTAASALGLIQLVSLDAEIAPHASPRWVLGGIDSALGNTQLAYVEVPNRPLTGTITGVLGISKSLLGNMRLALAEEEGDSSAKVWSVDAQNSLALSDQAAVANFARRVLASSTIALSVAATTAIVRSISADSVLALSDGAGTTAIKSVLAESDLALSVSADLYPWTVTEVSAESVLSLDQSADATTKCVVDVLASSALELVSDAAGRHAHFSPSAESELDLATTATGRYARFWPSAETTIALSQTANGFMSVAINVGAESVVTLSTEAAGRHSHFRPNASSVISASHSAIASGCFSRHTESVLQVATQNYDPVRDELVTTLVGLQDFGDVCRTASRAARIVIPLGHSAEAVRVKSTAIDVSATNVLELTDQLRKNETGDAISSIAFSQDAVAQRCKPISSVVELADSAGALVVRKRSASSALELRQSVAFSIVRADLTDKYHPFIGEGAPGAPTPPPANLVGPLTGVTVPFQLLYPATGPITDSVTLRSPNLGNKDRLSFNRIVRETRGGTLVVYADPIWPKIQTLILSFSGLKSTEAQALLAFFDSHLGQEIGLLDWEHRYWVGVVTAPDDPVVQDGKDSFSASFEFEGELDPAWTP